jgi:hypothetical protein
MDNSVKAALITVAGGLVVALVKWGLDRKKARRSVIAKTGDITNSLVAVGNNINQHHGGVQNYYGSQETGPFAGKVATKPNLFDIVEAFKTAKPFDRAQLPKNYIGVKVSWPVRFYSIYEGSEGKWTASFGVPAGTYLTVIVDIDIDKYPKLRVVESGHPAWVEGTIQYTSTALTRLEDDAEITLE